MSVTLLNHQYSSLFQQQENARNRNAIEIEMKKY